MLFFWRFNKPQVLNTVAALEIIQDHSVYYKIRFNSFYSQKNLDYWARSLYFLIYIVVYFMVYFLIYFLVYFLIFVRFFCDIFSDYWARSLHRPVAYGSWAPFMPFHQTDEEIESYKRKYCNTQMNNFRKICSSKDLGGGGIFYTSNLLKRLRCFLLICAASGLVFFW